MLAEVDFDIEAVVARVRVVVRHVDEVRHEPDSLVDWQDQERAASPHFPGYQRIRLERVSFHRGWDVADWEFRWTPSSGTLHVLDRNLRVSDRRAYALYWSVPDQDWASTRSTFTVIANSFRPAS